MKHTFLRGVSLLLLAATLTSVLAGCQKPAENTTVGTTTTAPNTTGTTGLLPPGTNPGVTLEFPVEGDIVVSEVMTSNTSTVKDSFGEYTDWIELYNTTDKALSLAGCFLSDNESKLYEYELPPVTMGPYEYLVLFASDRNLRDKEGELHTNFKLSAGEGVYLSRMGEMISSLVTPPDLTDDITYGQMQDSEGFTRGYFAAPTPRSQNGGPFAEVFAELDLSEIGIRINEFMMKNETTLYDEDGDCPDWVELCNVSDAPISLKGFGLSDKFSDPLKWTFPDITLQPGEYLLVLLSGKTKTYDENSVYLHADFKLSKDDSGLILSNEKGIFIDRIATVELPDSASYGRDPAEITAWKFFTRPTPGKENSKNGFDTLDAFNLGATQKVYISEVCSVSSTKVSALPNQDWIELYNNTDETVNLSGWSMSKSIGDLRFYSFPDVSIAPHSYLTVSASGKASQSTKTPDVGFKVSQTGATIYLVDSEGVVTDAFATGLQRAGVTSGRVVENGSLTRKFFATPSKGKENVTDGSSHSFAQPPVLESSAGVLVAEGHTVTLSTLQKGGVIYYTTDGTAPTDASNLYTEPLVLEKSTSIRAIVYAEGYLPSEIATQTFLIEDEHSLNVVCLTCDPEDLFGYSKGIWANGPGWTSAYPHRGANFWKDWEREVFFEYYEKDGTLGISFSAGIKNHGQYSRAQKQKSVSINLKEAYGSGTAFYPFFGDASPATFDNLLLRTGGQDQQYTNLIDAYCARVVSGQMDLDLMNDRPVAVYVNGEYWGLYYIRDKINESYVYYRHGIEADNLDMIKGTTSAQTGTYDAHKALLNYIKKNDLSKQEHFDYVASQIDIEEWTNYWIAQSYFANTDTGNIRFYCTRDGEGKWRWILFDLDWALFRSTYRWNMIEEFINPDGHGVGNSFSTTIAVGLFKNQEYKTYFIEKYAEYMHTVFTVERMLAILDEMVNEIDAEMVRHCARWGTVSYKTWQKNIDKLETIITERWDYSKGDLKETFKLSDAYMKELFPEDA